MSSNGTSPRVAETENSLEKIKRQLSSGSGRHLLQGPLLKRSETLRKWNERWIILDPTTGKMEYKIRRNEQLVKGAIVFDASSTITLSPVNFHGLPKYEGCCFYIGTPQKKEYFLCAETPGAARAWVSTLQATQLVLRAHKEAVNSLSGSGSAKLGTVATAVAAANSMAMEASKEVEAAMKISMRAALGLIKNKPNEDFATSNKANEHEFDDLTIMKETLQVKDEELQQLAKDIRARDATIKEITDQLNKTSAAAEAAASAVQAIDEDRRFLCTENERLSKDLEKQVQSFQVKFRESEEQLLALRKEREIILKQRDAALQEAQLWRTELAKAREHAVVLEAAMLRAEERARVSEADAEAKLKDAADTAAAAAKEKKELLAYIKVLRSQVERSNTKQVVEEKSESSSTNDDTLPLTKHVDSSDDNVDKACLSDSRPLPESEDSEVQLAIDGVEIRSVGDQEWSDIQPTDSGISDVREIRPEAEGSSLDEHHQHSGNSFQP